MAAVALLVGFIVYCVSAIVIASILSALLYIIARRRFNHLLEENRGMIWASIFAPFFGVVWAFIAFLIHVQISNRLAHQDCGFSSDPYVTMPNGYVVGSLNTYDGYVHAPGYKTQVPVTGPGYVRSTSSIRYEKGIFEGTLYELDGTVAATPIDAFRFDTRTRNIQVWPTGQKAAWDPNRPSPESIWVLYSQYRHQWPKKVSLTILLAGESLIVVALWSRWKALENELLTS